MVLYQQSAPAQKHHKKQVAQVQQQPAQDVHYSLGLRIFSGVVGLCMALIIVGCVVLWYRTLWGAKMWVIKQKAKARREGWLEANDEYHYHR